MSNLTREKNLQILRSLKAGSIKLSELTKHEDLRNLSRPLTLAEYQSIQEILPDYTRATSVSLVMWCLENNGLWNGEYTEQEMMQIIWERDVQAAKKNAIAGNAFIHIAPPPTYSRRDFNQNEE